MQICFIGLGVMGGAMARHLAKAGYKVVGYDPDPEAGKDIARKPSAADAARDADIIITMLPHGGVVASVVDEILPVCKAGALLVDTSSAEPWLTRETAERLAARGVSMVDAPVSGASWGAESATLVFMVGGSDADVARIRPLLDVMGKATHHVGPLGAGHAMKTINNIITAMTVIGTTEAMLIGKAYGLDPSAMADVLNVSTGQSFWTTERLHQDVLNRKFEDGFKLSLMHKDVEIATRLGRELGLDLPFLEAGRAMWEDADERLGPGAPVTAFVRYVEEKTGLRLDDSDDSA